MILHKLSVILLSGTLLALSSGVLLASEAKSGYDFIKPATRAMQDDDFENPGMLTLEQGQELFNEKQNGISKACSDCHGQDGLEMDTKSIARYPVYGASNGGIVTLQKRISNCRDNIGRKPLPPNHTELIALETFVRNRAAGEAVNVQTDGPMAELLNKGQDIYQTRFGLIDMSCSHCHALYPGQMIRGQKISQGQGNGFPAYRLDIGEITNLHQRIQQCMTLMRAEPFATDSEEIKLLGLYIMSRSNGLKIETPAVRY
jgi:sulfur-oxidizing protein SoxA